MKDTSKLAKLNKLIVKALADENTTKAQFAEAVGTSPQYLNYILYEAHSDGKYIPAIITTLELDPRKVEKTMAA